MYIHSYTDASKQIYTFIYTHIHTYIHTHTHTHSYLDTYTSIPATDHGGARAARRRPRLPQIHQIQKSNPHYLTCRSRLRPRRYHRTDKNKIIYVYIYIYMCVYMFSIFFNHVFVLVDAIALLK